MFKTNNSWFSKRFLKYFSINFFPLLLLLIAITLFIEQTNRDKELFTIKSEANAKLSSYTKLISGQFQMISSDLIVLAESSSLRNFIEKNTHKTRCNVEKLFLSFSSRKKLYDQIRFLDTLGNEKIRVNFNNGNPQVVPENKLQNKRDRYYFQNTLMLDKETVFLSPFDLNVENGKIEEPLKPMIRFGIPVFNSKNKKVGIIIINYLGNKLLDNFNSSDNDTASQTMLLNQNGYWLYNSKKENEWGFMYKAGVNLTFQAVFNKEWEIIKHNNNGQFLDNNGLFTYTTIFPLKEVQGVLEKKINSIENYYWKLISFYPKSKLESHISSILGKYRVIEIFILIMILFISIIIAKIRLSRREVIEKSTLELKKLSYAIEYAPVIVEITDIHGNIEYVNPYFTEITGYTKEEAFTKYISILKLGNLPAKLYDEMWKTLNNQMVWSKELENRKKNGNTYWENVSISPVMDDTGKTTNYVIVKEDITKRKLRDTELIEAKIAAEASTEAKSRFLASMSHEIRTPMNAILGFSHLVLNTELTPQQLNYLKKIELSARALLNIINDILDFSKIEANELTIEKIEFNVEDVITSVTTLIAQKAFDKGLELLIHIAPQVPLYLIGDPLRLGQILTNFCNNAVKFTPKGEIVVEVTLLSENSEEAELLFAVKDTGIGIRNNKKDKLFKAFQQADTSTTREFGGTGLGLVIAENLAKLMQGSIWFKSKENEGSTFFFSAKFIKQQRKDIINSFPNELKNIEVLLCADNLTANQFLIEILETYFSNVTSVNSREKALKALENNSYKLFISDCRELENENISSLSYIKNQYNIPIIMLSSAPMQEEIIKPEIANIIDVFLFKPINYSNLFNAILEIFEKTIKRNPQIENNLNRLSEIPEKLKNSQILLAEDNEINQQVAVEILNQFGIKTEVAENGLEALEMIKNSGTPSKYALILMDVQMPEMDGFTATQKILSFEEYKTIPIIAITADAMVDVKEKCLNTGMVDYITKPIEPSALLKMLIKWIEPETTDNNNETIKKENHDIKIPNNEQINITEGLKYTGGNKELFVNLLQKFLNKYYNFEDKINNYNKDSLLTFLHSLKSDTKMLGISNLHDVVVTTEKELKNSTDTNIKLYKEKLISALVPVITSLKSFYEKSHTKQENQTISEKDKKILKDLETLLKLHDSEAISLSKRLPIIVGFEERINELTQEINNYQFEKALTILSEIMDSK